MRPFYRVHIDLFPEIVAYNGHIWTIHFYDEFLRMNEVETFAHKSSTTQAIIRYLNRVEHQYNQKTAIIRIDGETSLGGDFHRWRDSGILLEQSAPYTKSQNGSAEHSGGVIIIKSRCMRIEARLPEELWPEVVRAAAYLINRTPNAQLDWMTPAQIQPPALSKA